MSSDFYRVTIALSSPPACFFRGRPFPDSAQVLRGLGHSEESVAFRAETDFPTGGRWAASERENEVIRHPTGAVLSATPLLRGSMLFRRLPIN